MVKRDKKEAGLQKKVSSVFKRVSIPQRDGDPQTGGTPTSEGTAGAPPKSARPDTLILQSSLMKNLLRSESSSDKDEMERPVGVPPKKTVPDHPIQQHLSMEETPQAKDTSDKLKPNCTVSIPSWMKGPDFADKQNAFINEPTPSEDSSTQKESDLTDQVSQIIQDESIPQLFSLEKPQKAKNNSDKVAPSRKSWVPPKLTTPDRPISKASLTKKPEQVERRDKTEPGRTDVSNPQKNAAAKDPAPQNSITKNLYQAGSAPKTSAPDRGVDTPSTPKSGDPQSLQDSESKKRYGPGAPPKEAASSRQPKTTALAEASSPSLWQQINNRLFAPKPGVSPARQKVMVISIPILAIVLIFAFRQVLSKSPHKTKGANAEGATLLVETNSDHEIDWQIPEQLPATMRDPTQLPFQNNTQTEEQKQTAIIPKTELIHLGAIVYSRNKSSAVVNGRITHVGDVVSGVTILRINRDSVEFERDSEKWVQKVRD